MSKTKSKMKMVGTDSTPSLNSSAPLAENIRDAVECVPTELVAPLEARNREIAETISAAYAEAKGQFDTALRKVVVCGLLMIEQKEQTKHGEFGPWLEQYCPEISWMTATRWMNTAHSVCEILQISHDVKFGGLKPAVLFQLAESDLADKKAANLLNEFHALVDGKTQKQLLLEWKDSQPAAKKHHAKKQTAKEQAEEAEAAALSLVNGVLGDIRLLLEGPTLGLVPDAKREELLEQCIELNNRLRELSKGKGKGGKK